MIYIYIIHIYSHYYIICINMSMRPSLTEFGNAGLTAPSRVNEPVAYICMFVKHRHIYIYTMVHHIAAPEKLLIKWKSSSWS